MDIAVVLKALANERRIQILGWLKDPRAHFRPQVDGSVQLPRLHLRQRADRAVHRDRQAANLAALLEAFGFSFAHVVRGTVYLTSMADFCRHECRLCETLQGALSGPYDVGHL